MLSIQDIINTPATLPAARLQLEKIERRHVAEIIASTERSIADLDFIHWVHRPGQPWRDPSHWERIIQDVTSGKYLIYPAFESQTRRYVGYVDLFTFEPEVPSCGIGYVGDSAVRGQGLMREAVLRVVDLAFELGVHRIQATCDTRNTRSIQFTEMALGFVREGIHRHYERDVRGELSDEMVFSRLSTDAG